MRKFLDKNGATWSIILDAEGMERVRSKAGIDLRRLFTTRPPLKDIGHALGEEGLAAALCLLSLPQGSRKPAAPEDFVAALDPAALERAADALMQALIDQVPEKAARRVLRQLWAGGVKHPTNN